MDFHNGARMHKDDAKVGPSGMSCNEAFSLPESWGGQNCLLPIDIVIIRELKEAMGGSVLLQFTSTEFSQLAQALYDTLNMAELTFENVWSVFNVLYPLVFP
jgi:hypothetical protein